MRAKADGIRFFPASRPSPFVMNHPKIAVAFAHRDEMYARRTENSDAAKNRAAIDQLGELLKELTHEMLAGVGT